MFGFEDPELSKAFLELFPELDTEVDETTLLSNDPTIISLPQESISLTQEMLNEITDTSYESFEENEENTPHPISENLNAAPTQLPPIPSLPPGVTMFNPAPNTNKTIRRQSATIPRPVTPNHSIHASHKQLSIIAKLPVIWDHIEHNYRFNIPTCNNSTEAQKIINKLKKYTQGQNVFQLINERIYISAPGYFLFIQSLLRDYKKQASPFLPPTFTKSSTNGYYCATIIDTSLMSAREYIIATANLLQANNMKLSQHIIVNESHVSFIDKDFFSITVSLSEDAYNLLYKPQPESYFYRGL